ncbi:MAG: hypothetical protein IJP16_10240 [Clostridia bacterium]|nr:hypothetical protein [Clostridia bacterium]
MKRILALTLAILMLLSSATVLFACKDKEEDDGEKKTEAKTYEEDSIFYERKPC